MFAATIGVIASVATSAVTHLLPRTRDVAHRRDQIRADLYGELIDLIVANEELDANRAKFSVSGVEIQKRRLRARHRLLLVATDSTIAAYDNYNAVLRADAEVPRDQWPDDRSAVFDARDALVVAMRAELRDWRNA